MARNQHPEIVAAGIPVLKNAVLSGYAARMLLSRFVGAGILFLVSLVFVSQGAAAEDRCHYEFTEQEAHYRNGAIELAGVWFMPHTNEKVPAAVILQGSGTSGRSNLWSRSFAVALAKCGIGVLQTDKRGSDKSKGDWRTATFYDLALDGVAGLEFVTGQEKIDRDRIGFLGLSQGGHIAPLAARLSEDADFIIDASGGALPMKDMLIYELEQTYKQHGLDAAQIKYLQRLVHASFRYIETGEGWDDYLNIRNEIAAGPFRHAAESWPETKDHWYWTFWRNIHDYDSIPHWRHAVLEHGLPGIVFYGELDSKDNVNVEESVRRLRKALPTDSFRVVVYPEIGHSLFAPDSTELHPEMIDLMVNWIYDVK